jgi:hypothetical protein
LYRLEEFKVGKVLFIAESLHPQNIRDYRRDEAKSPKQSKNIAAEPSTLITVVGRVEAQPDTPFP